ncbi:MAG: ABC transporter permease [Acidobacteria bacterium]|nr:ABC transporter permease [Acidobacteriota bacterium]
MDRWRRELDGRCTAAVLEPFVREEVQREIAEHLEDRFDELVQGGASVDDADRAVVGEMPDSDAIRRLARSRQAHRLLPPAVTTASAPIDGRRHRLAALGRDLLYAWRSFRRDPTFTIAAIGTLALCLAANTAVFSVVDTVLLRAVDVPDGGRLVQLGNIYPGAGASANRGGNSGVPDYFDRLAAVSALPEQAMFRTHGVSLGDTSAERLTAITTTPSFFPMLRSQAALGRTFTDDEAIEGRHRRVVLSDGLWRRRFAASPDVVGQSVVIGGVPHEVVGVMPAQFRFYDDEVALWLPAAFTAEERSDASRHSNNWTHVGRLAPGTTIEQVQAQVSALNAANLDRFPAMKQALVDAGFHTRVDSVADVLSADLARPLYLLWAGVACVLLIGVVNLASLTLARATSRRSEMATRVALGADPAHVRAQLVTEHLALAVAGGGAGVLLALGLLQAIPALGSALLPPGRTLAFDPRAAAYAGALTVAVGLALGLTAVRALGSSAPAAALRDEGRSRTGSRAARRVRQALVMGQVALACMLLVGAGVLLESFRRLLVVETGFQPSVVTGAVSLPLAVYPSDAERLAFLQRLLDALRAGAQVRAAGATTGIPFGDNRSDSVVWPEDQPIAPGVGFVSPDRIVVSPGYFEAMGMPIVAGRAFETADDGTREPLVIVDARLAERFWPGRDAVGRYLIEPTSAEALTKPSPDNMRRHRVVGVVREVKQHALVTPADAVGSYYYPMGQEVPGGVTVAVSSAAPASAVGADLRRLLAELDPRLPLFDVKIMQERIDRALGARRATTTLALAFGALALVLSAVGLYGVLAYLVALRTREIGIRMALGGSAPAIAGLVFRESLMVVGVGLVAGLAGAAWLGRLIASELVEVGIFDPVAVSFSVGLLVIAALAATAAPARRALRVDPAVTLAAE